jgi:hypothetical protein
VRARLETKTCFAVVEAMASTAKTVKDVPSHDFVRAYAAHLKRSGKVNVPIFCKKEKRIDKGVENL